MSAFHRILLCIPFLAALNLLSGCAAPGSSITRAALSGRIVDAQGHAVAGQQVEVMLPAQYGLAGLDAVWGQPEDYGHQTQRVTLQTDADGKFSCIFSPTTYSISFWIFPPLGTFPRQPPRPFVAMRIASRSPDIMVAGMDHGHFDYRVWDHATGKFRQDSSARLSGSYTFLKSEKAPDGNRTIAGWLMNLTLVEP